MYYEVLPEGIKVYIKVYPQSGKLSIKNISSDLICVYLKKAPEKEKANKELCSFVGKLLKLPLKNISIIKGSKSRLKVLLIKGASVDLLEEALKLAD